MASHIRPIEVSKKALVTNLVYLLLWNISEPYWVGEEKEEVEEGFKLDQDHFIIIFSFIDWVYVPWFKIILNCLIECDKHLLAFSSWSVIVLALMFRSVTIF